MISASEVLSFWFQELQPSDWYNSSPQLDDRIRSRFLPAWEKAANGELGTWLTDAHGALAYLIVTDQLPRNMFRGSGTSFTLVGVARSAAKLAIEKGWDMEVKERKRQFFYLPLMHSESIVDQDRCVELFETRMSEESASNLLHAKAHRWVIQEFGRFPYRNEALERDTTEAEAAFLEAGGYGVAVKKFQDA